MKKHNKPNKQLRSYLLFFIIGVIDVLICLIFSLILQKYKWTESGQNEN